MGLCWVIVVGDPSHNGVEGVGEVNGGAGMVDGGIEDGESSEESGEEGEG